MPRDPDKDFLPFQEGKRMLGGSSPVLDKNNKVISLLTDATKKLAKEVNEGVTGLTEARVTVGGALLLVSRGLNQSNEIQKSALALGTDANRILKSNNALLTDLPGGTFLPLQERLKQLEVGFKENNAGLMDVAVRMRLSGQETKGLINAMSLLRFEGRINSESIGDLSIRLHDTARSNFVSMSALSKSILSLKNQMADLGLLGVSQQITEAKAMLVARLGIGTDQILTKSVNLLVGATQKDMAARLRLGIDEHSRRLASGRLNAKQTAEVILEAAFMAEKVQKRFLAGAGVLGFRQVGILKEVFGDPNIAALAAVADASRTQTTVNGKLSDITESLDARMQAILRPLQELVIQVLPIIISNLKLIISAMIGLKAALIINSVSQAGGIGRGIAKGGAGILAGLAKFGKIAGRFLLPFGVVGGAAFLALTFLPDLLKFIGVTGKKSEDHLKNISRSPGIIGQKPGTTSIRALHAEAMNEFGKRIDMALNKIIFSDPTTTTVNSEQLEHTKRMADSLDQISENTGRTSFSRVPLKGVR